MAQAAKLAGFNSVAPSANSGITFCNTAAGSVITPSNAATSGFAEIQGRIRVSTGGTIIPLVTLSVAAAATVNADSFFEIYPVGSNTQTSEGNWQ